MSEWNLALAAIGQVIALGAVIVTAMKEINAQIERRFAENERLRVAAETKWDERFILRDRLHQDLLKRLEDAVDEHTPMRQATERVAAELNDFRLNLPKQYVDLDRWMEHWGALNIRLEKLADRFSKHAADEVRIKPRKPRRIT